MTVDYPRSNSDPEESQQKPAGRFTNILALLLLALAAIAGIASIHEITVRQDLCTFLDKQAKDLGLQIANSGGDRVGTESPDGRASKAKIRRINRLHNELEALAATGAVRQGRTVDVISGEALRIIAFDDLTPMTRPSDSSLARLLPRVFSTLNSDYLLALALVSCGAFGAIVFELRVYRKGLLQYRHMILGLAAGFIVFLSIKGGKAVFLIDRKADLVNFNPYSSGLLAMLAGLYTEKSYRVLSEMFRNLTERVRTHRV